IFVGIETPEADALKAMRKSQNVAVPMMESIKTLNDYGLEVTSGIILGLDTDSDETEARLKDFIDISRIPMLTINLLQALPKTPLWDRLKLAGRLEDDPTRESNVRFLRPYEDVVSMWRRCIAHANDPERLFARFYHQVDATYVNRLIPPARGKLNWGNLSSGLVLAFRVLVHIGILSDYRRPFWQAARHALRRGQIDAVLGMGFIAHHLIQFTREALRGEQNASYYSTKTRTDEPLHSPQLAAVRQSAYALHGREPAPQLRLERGRPQRAIGPVLERHGHDLRRSADCDVTEKLQARARRLVRCARRLHVDELRPERVVELVLREASGVDRARHEFPERLEILEHRLVGIVVMRGGVVHVGGEPQRVAHGCPLDE